ncbi:phosphatidylinositol 4-phosphate 5-kinase 8 [Pelomyxa schiedti]|nr:phosphatidylinositol 4-phosphate 5-kinase 8 [Pelomyxa schiedti]
MHALSVLETTASMEIFTPKVSEKKHHYGLKISEYHRAFMNACQICMHPSSAAMPEIFPPKCRVENVKALIHGHLGVARMIVVRGGAANEEAQDEVDKAMGGHHKYEQWLIECAHPTVAIPQLEEEVRALKSKLSTTELILRPVNNTSSPGETYSGRLVNGKNDGMGTCKFINGDTYDGVWLNGDKNGRGVYRWPNGETHEGEWLNDKMDGWGVAHCAGGGWYVGLCRDDHWKRGTWHDGDGVDVWDGEWVWNATENTNEMQGWGVQRRMTTNGGASVKMVVTVYEGEWDRDQWHGVGTWMSPDGLGDIYHGQFDHGKKCGTGSILFGGGGSYVGGWKDDVFHGRGVRLWANGDRYDGQWVGGKEHGEGTKTWSRDGSSFTGLWEGGVPTKGTMRWPNGDMFEGTFTQVRRVWSWSDWEFMNGEGTLTLSKSSSGGFGMMKGTLNNNQFEGVSCPGVKHQMGSSLPQFEHWQQIEKLKTEATKEKSEIVAKLKEEMRAAKEEWEKLKEVHTKRKRELENKLMNLQAQFSSLMEETQKEKAKDKLRIRQLEEEVSGLNTKLSAMEAKQNSAKKEWETDTFFFKQATKILNEQHAEELNQMKQVQDQQEECNSMRPTTAMPELNEAFRLATLFQTQLEQSVPQFLLLQESLQNLTRNLEGATKHNEELASHLQKLSGLRCTLEGKLNKSDEGCKEILGKNLTVRNSEAEIQECSRRISSLTKIWGMQGLMAEKNIVSATEECEPVDEGLLEPLIVPLKPQDDEPFTPPFQLLCTLTNTLAQLQSCRFEEFTKLADRHTELSKELSEQVSIGGTQRGNTERMFRAEERAQEQVDASARAQQAIVDISLSKASSCFGTNSSCSQHNQPTPTAVGTLPGHTSSPPDVPPSTTTSGSATVMVCIECDERPPNMQFQPCGHVVLCSQCGATVRKCPHCRVPIKTKIQIP